MADRQDAFDRVPNKKAKSDVWGHFWVQINKETQKQVEGVAICRICDHTVKYSGGTTNLNSHITRHHPSALKVKTERSHIPDVNTTQIVPPKPEEVKKTQTTIPGLINAAAKYPFHSARATRITKSIARYIIDDMRPLRVVEGPGFMNMIQSLEPRYDLPCRTYFTQTVIPQMYEESVLKVKNSLSVASTVALTTDGWTSRATESYITITSVHISPDWKLQNFVLQTRAMPESHMGLNIAGVIREAVVEWGVPGNPPLVTDNASNMTVAAQELQSKPHIGCFAHCLNLAAQKALKIETVSKLLARVRKIVGYFHRSTTAAALLKSKISLLGLNDLKLIQDVPTRWNSAADMLERYLYLQPAIYATLVTNEINTRDSDLSTLSQENTRVATAVMECLLPLRDITAAVCTEKTPTVSIILPLIGKIQKVMTVNDTDQPIVRQIKSAVTNNLSTRYTSDEITSFLEECTVLDPRFKDTYFEPDRLCTIYHRLPFICSGMIIKVKAEQQEQATAASQPAAQKLPQLPQLPGIMDQDENTASINTSQQEPAPAPQSAPTTASTKQGLAAILEDVVVVKEEKGNKTPLERASEEVARYKDVAQISIKENPLNWWKDNCFFYPLLSQLVKQRLCIPATSVPSERVFSLAGDIVTAQRAALNPDIVDKLIFLKKNSV